MKASLRTYIFSIMIMALAAVSQFEAAGQGYVITTPSDRDIVYNKYIRLFYKDTDGFVWVGTGNGVERLDGISQKPYPLDASFPDNSHIEINALLEVAPRKMWAGNAFGLWELNHATQKAERIFKDEINFKVNSIAKGKAGVIYVGGSHGLYAIKGETVKRISPSPDDILSGNVEVMDMVMDNEGNVCLLTSKGLTVYNPTSDASRTFTSPAGTGTLTSMTSYGNDLFVGTSTGAVLRFNTSLESFNQLPHKSNSAVTSLSYENGLLAVGTQSDGVVILNTSTGKVRYSAHQSSDPGKGLISNTIQDVFLSDGDLWIATGYYLGFNLLKNVGTPLRTYSSGKFSTETLTVRSALQIGDEVFVGTREGFYISNDKTGDLRFFNLANSRGALRSEMIFSFFEHDGILYIGTCKGGVSSFDIKSGRFVDTKLSKTLTSNDIFMFMEHDGLIWLATTDGLYRYDPKSGDIKVYSGVNNNLPGNMAYSIFVDSTGRFWVGTDKGIALFNPSNGSYKKAPLPDEAVAGRIIRHIMEGRDGSLLFFIRDGASLYVVDKELSKDRMIDGLDGFNGIVDRHGNFFIGGNHGIIKADGKFHDIDLIQIDGMLNSKGGTSSGAAISFTPAGELLIPAMKGLIILDPEHELHKFPVNITSVTVNGAQRYDDYDLSGGTVLKLKEDENNVSFSFASLGYESPENFRWEYRLMPADTTWRWIAGENSVAYYNLKPGEYTFSVRRALSPDSEVGVTIEIEGGKMSAWIAIISVIILIAIGLGVWTVFRKRKKSDEERAEDEVLEPEPVVESVSQTEEPETVSRISEEKARAVIAKMNRYMEEEKPYLNPEMKQSELASAIDVAPYVLSRIFTSHLKESYYEYLNDYRVEEFKRMVARGDHHKYTVTTMMNHCGFRSRSSFSRAFKRVTGTTSTDYIQKNG